MHFTIMQFMEKTVKKYGYLPALRYKKYGIWKKITWNEYFDQIKSTAKAFIKLGLKPGNSVVIIGSNSSNWFISNIAAIFAGGIPAGIYSTSSYEQCKYITNNCKAVIAIADSKHHLNNFLKLKSEIKSLKAIVSLDNTLNMGKNLIKWNQLDVLSEKVPDNLLKIRIKKQKPEDLCTLIYTSGTTGNPKGVMLTHDNLTWTSNNITNLIKVGCNDRIISYLPISHIAEQIVSMYGTMAVGASVWFAESMDKLVDNLKEVKPTIFIGVPRVWEKIQAKIQAVGKDSKNYQKKFVNWAVQTGLEHGYKQQENNIEPFLYKAIKHNILSKIEHKIPIPEGIHSIIWDISENIKVLGTDKIFNYELIRNFLDRIVLPVNSTSNTNKQSELNALFGEIFINIPKSFKFTLADFLLFSKVRKKLGLDECRFALTSTAPIPKETLKFFLGLGIPLLEVYGMSECTGPATISLPNRYKTGKAGFALPKTKVSIADDGEILIKGRHVFKGYYKDKVETNKTINKQGWLCSGDIGQLDNNGFLKITDRKKDIIITSGGKNIAPQEIEAKMKTISSIEYAVVVGDKKKYLTMLVTLNRENFKTELKKSGSKVHTITEACLCPIFNDYINKQINKINSTLSRVQTIKRFKILKHEFSIKSGDLTPTMKLKRKFIINKFKKEINDLYQGFTLK